MTNMNFIKQNIKNVDHVNIHVYSFKIKENY